MLARFRRWWANVRILAARPWCQRVAWSIVVLGMPLNLWLAYGLHTRLSVASRWNPRAKLLHRDDSCEIYTMKDRRGRILAMSIAEPRR